MAKRAQKSTAVRIPRLSEAATAAYDELVKAVRGIARLRKHEKAAAAAKEVLDREFCGAPLAETADGRCVQRNVETREWPPLPAKTVTIVRYAEADNWKWG
jgi:hypothetical protein